MPLIRTIALMKENAVGTSTPPGDVDVRIDAVADAVRRRRIALGLDQQGLADLAGCSTRFVQSLEGAKPTLRLSLVLDVLEVLGLGLTLTTATAGPVDPGVEPLLAEPGRRAVGRG
jgi:y4mF family transcriptional regulator